MNAQQKAKILREAGYVDIKTPKDYQWYWNDTVVSWTDDKGSIPHTTDAAYEHYLKDHATVPTVESPTPDSAIEDSSAWVSLAKKQWDDLLAEKIALEKELAKAQADLAAAQNIIVQAGKDFEALNGKIEYLHKKVYSHYAEAKDKATKASMGGDTDKECYYGGIEDELGIILGAFSNVGLPKVKNATQAPSPAQAVTLTEDLVYWFASRDCGNGNFIAYHCDAPHPYKYADVISDNQAFAVFRMKDEFITPANRAAIAAKRAELGLS